MLAKLPEQAELGRRQGQAKGRGVGHEEAARMRLEGERHQRRAQRRGKLGGLCQQGLVAAMHAVEIAERHHAALPGGRRIPPVFENGSHLAGFVQAGRRGTSTTASPSITTLSPLRHWVLSATRRLAASIAVIVAMAVIVSPISTGAMKFMVCET